MAFQDDLLVKSRASVQIDVSVHVSSVLHSRLARTAGVRKVILLDRPARLDALIPRDAAHVRISLRSNGAKLHLSLDQGGVPPDWDNSMVAL